MSETGEWLGPAIAVIWLLVRVVPRLFRARSSTREVEGTGTLGFPTTSTDSERPSATEPPPPIEPR